MKALNKAQNKNFSSIAGDSLHFRAGVAAARLVAFALLVVGFSACGNSNNGTAQQGQCGWGQSWNGSTCVQSNHQTNQCGWGQIWNGSMCVTSGQHANTCGAGQVQTTYGCAPIAPQGACQSTPGYNPSQIYGWVNNQCFPANPYHYNGQYNQCGTQNGMPMVMTQYNCLPQGHCPPGYGQLQPGQCIPGSNGGAGQPYGWSGSWSWGWGWR